MERLDAAWRLDARSAENSSCDGRQMGRPALGSAADAAQTSGALAAESQKAAEPALVRLPSLKLFEVELATPAERRSLTPALDRAGRQSHCGGHRTAGHQVPQRGTLGGRPLTHGPRPHQDDRPSRAHGRCEAARPTRMSCCCRACLLPSAALGGRSSLATLEAGRSPCAGSTHLQKCAGRGHTCQSNRTGQCRENRHELSAPTKVGAPTTATGDTFPGSSFCRWPDA